MYFFSTLYEKRRTEANVDEAKEFVNTYLNALTELNTKLEGQRAARHFIVQVMERKGQRFLKLLD